MKKDSPEQYLKYLAALSLTVAAPAVAAPAAGIPAAAEPSAHTQVVKASQNLVTLAVTSTDELAEACAGWPESTYVRRITPTPRVERQADTGASLAELMDEVLK